MQSERDSLVSFMYCLIHSRKIKDRHRGGWARSAQSEMSDQTGLRGPGA
jgi:hypothetical protein